MKVIDNPMTPRVINKNMFFIDTCGDATNFQKNYLISNSKISYPLLPPMETITTVTHSNKNNLSIRKLREIVVDGLNIAFGYSHQKNFSKMGLQLVLNYFQNRGHTIKIFLPQNQRNRNREYLEKWYNEGLLIFTPSRNIGGKKITPYDDRFILDYATKCKGIVVSSDQYRDLWQEKPEWRETIEKRLLTPTFVGDYVMFPEDPLGRSGPKLDEFLRH